MIKLTPYSLIHRGRYQRLYLLPELKRLQPLDLSVNKAAKEFLRKQFNGWYSDKIYYQLRNGVKPMQSIDLRLSVVKPLGARWMISLYDYFKAKPEIIKNGFKEAGITFTA